MEENNINSKCPNCGSHLKYDPRSKKIKCISCDSLFDVESLGKGNLDEEEYDYEEMLVKLRETKLTKKLVASLNCKNCGASLTLNDSTTSSVCPFCGSSHIIETNIEEEVIPISGIIPFNIDKKDCNLRFHNWIKHKFFAPDEFKKNSYSLNLYQIYLPFWTFDMKCYTRYEAERGDYEEKWVEKTDIDGNVVRESERELVWSSVSGHCHNDFDDVLVLGSSNQKNHYYINRVSNFKFDAMEKFNPQFLVGYPGEKISLPLEQGLEKAKSYIYPEIEETIERKVGGDEVRILSTITQYEDITFKQVVAPIYNGIYSYKGKNYVFVMNGQTGKFAGAYPVSGAKVFAFVIAILAIITLVVLFPILFLG